MSESGSFLPSQCFVKYISKQVCALNKRQQSNLTGGNACKSKGKGKGHMQDVERRRLRQFKRGKKSKKKKGRVWKKEKSFFSHIFEKEAKGFVRSILSFFHPDNINVHRAKQAIKQSQLKFSTFIYFTFVPSSLSLCCLSLSASLPCGIFTVW